MNATTFDALGAARALEAAGVERRQAEAHAEALRRAATADRDTLATKADVVRLEAATKAGLAALKTGLAELRADLYRALWIQGSAIVAILGGFIAIAAALKLL